MTRSLSATNQTQSEAATSAPVLFLKLALDSGNILMHSNVGSITWGGDTYTGVGDLGEVSTIDETADLGRSTVEFKLSAIPAAIISTVLGQYYQGRTATLFLGFLNTTTNVLVDTPLTLFKGRIDTSKIMLGQEAVIVLTAESRFAAWDRPNTSRYNHADQRSRYTGDRGLEYAEQASEKQIAWGQKLQ